MSFFRRLLERVEAPVHAGSVVAFRVMFGTLMCASAVRFLVKGSVDRCFVEPVFFFKYWGFAWVEVASRGVMIAVCCAMATFAALIAIGFLYRVASVGFLLAFTYVHLIDVTNYLNHYYLVTLLGLLLCVVPANRSCSIDARIGLARRTATVPAWSLGILRFQVAVVYLGAALAKVGSDWLLHAEPIAIWMSSRADVPGIGALLLRHDVALAMSWAGFLNDLLAVPLLMRRRTRAAGFVMIVVFHSVTSYFFNIGIFPVLMPIGATLFFEPDWPERARSWVAAKLGRDARNAVAVVDDTSKPAPAPRRSRAGSTLLIGSLVLYAVVQVVVPLRTFLYGGGVLWHEQGMRFSWRVMLRKKTGSITYRVRRPGRSFDVEVHPRRYLNDFQEREFAGQPDLVLQLAHHIHDDLARRGFGDVQVRVDAWVSLNGRVATRMIDPNVDLAKVHDGLARAEYVLPAPQGPPARLARR